MFTQGMDIQILSEKVKKSNLKMLLFYKIVVKPTPLFVVLTQLK